MNSPVSPCKDCPKKGCGTYHDECQMYLKWKADWDIYKAEQKAEQHARQFKWGRCKW